MTTARPLRKQLKRAPKAPDVASGFHDVFGSAPHPVLLVDLSGQVLGINATAGERYATGSSITELFEDSIEGAASIVFMVGRKAKETGYADQVVGTTSGDVRLVVQSVHDKHQIWHILPVEPPQHGLSEAGDGASSRGEGVRTGGWDDSGLENLPVAIARIDNTGTILTANAAARKLLNLKTNSGTVIMDILEVHLDVLAHVNTTSGLV